MIAKGYVADKRINEKGEHIIDLTCWAETLDSRLIQIVAASAKLPSRNAWMIQTVNMQLREKPKRPYYDR